MSSKSTPKRKPRPKAPEAKRPTILSDGRRNNSGKRGNRGGGRKPWQPKPKQVENRTRNGWRMQTQEEAWADARALVRHMAAIGFPVSVMGRFLSPAISDEKTFRKHFEWEIENGKFQADMTVAGVAYRMATSGRHETSTWRWLSRRVEGFGEKVDLNLNAPIPVRSIPGDETI